MKPSLIICALIAFQFSFNVSAKMKSHYSASKFEPSLVSLPDVNENKVLERLKISEKKRKPAANSNIDESMMSSELKKIINRVHECKSSEDLEDLFTELNKNYDSYPKDVQFYITQALPMKSMRGMVYRLKPMFEKKSKFIHSQVLSWVKDAASSMKVLMPYEHIEAGFEYVASPYISQDGKVVASFKDEKEIQEYIAKEVMPLIVLSVKRLEALDLTDPVVWDQRISFGPKSFGDNVKRFKLIGEFEKNMVLSSAYSSLSSIAVFLAYNIENSIELYKEVGFLYGLDGFGFFNKVDGVSVEKIATVMRKPRFEQTGTLLANSEKWMEYAYTTSLKSIKRLNDAWSMSEEDRKNADSFIFNTGYLSINRDLISENINMANRIAWSKSAESMRSAVTGEVIQVSYHTMFSNPPLDLKEFLPVTFERGNTITRKVSKGIGSGQTLTYRNYSEGMAKSYNVKAFTPYFPNIKTQDDVFKTARVLSHMQGDWLKLIR